jgi:hypothetical protein
MTENIEKNEEMAFHFVNHMLTTKKVEFKWLFFQQSIRMSHTDVHKQENNIKLLCINEANKEHIILIVF